jgi:hypothetical protein
VIYGILKSTNVKGGGSLKFPYQKLRSCDINIIMRMGIHGYKDGKQSRDVQKQSFWPTAFQNNKWLLGKLDKNIYSNIKKVDVFLWMEMPYIIVMIAMYHVLEVIYIGLCHA